MSLWGALLGGCHFVLHAAGWLEGGLTASFEKFILDVEMLQMFAELFQPVPASAEEIGIEAVAEVGPGRPLLRRGPHHAALPRRFLHAAGVRLAQLRRLVGRTAPRPPPSAPPRLARARSPPSSRRRWMPAVHEELNAFVARRSEAAARRRSRSARRRPDSGRALIRRHFPSRMLSSFPGRSARIRKELP